MFKRYDQGPAVDIQFPVESQLYASIPLLSGTAQDNQNTKEVQVRMRIDHELAMGPEADLTWLALRLRTQLIERIERLERSQVEYRMAA